MAARPETVELLENGNGNRNQVAERDDEELEAATGSRWLDSVWMICWIVSEQPPQQVPAPQEKPTSGTDAAPSRTARRMARSLTPLQ